MTNLVQMPHAAQNAHLLAFLGLRVPDQELLGEAVAKFEIVGAHTEGKTVFFHCDALPAGDDQQVVRTYSRFSNFQAFHEQMVNWLVTNHPGTEDQVPNFPMKRNKVSEGEPLTLSTTQANPMAFLCSGHGLRVLPLAHAPLSPR